MSANTETRLCIETHLCDTGTHLCDSETHLCLGQYHDRTTLRPRRLGKRRRGAARQAPRAPPAPFIRATVSESAVLPAHPARCREGSALRRGPPGEARK